MEITIDICQAATRYSENYIDGLNCIIVTHQPLGEIVQGLIEIYGLPVLVSPAFAAYCPGCDYQISIANDYLD